MKNSIRLLLAMLIGLSIFAGCSKDDETKFGIKRIEAYPQKLGSIENSYLTVFMEEESDDLSYEWICDGGEFQWGAHSSSTQWFPPAVDGDYNIELTVTKGSKECHDNIILTVNGLFFDDFTGNLGKWDTSYADSWIENERAYLTGTITELYGILESDMSPNIFLPYSINVSIGRNSELNNYEHYGVFIETDDTGSTRIELLHFIIIPSNYAYNWEVGCYIEDDNQSGWYYLEDESRGTIDESLIEIGTQQNIEWIIEEDKSITVKLNGVTLYTSNILVYLEGVFGDEIGTKLDVLSFRTVESKEIFIDHILVSNPNRTQRVMTGKKLSNLVKSDNSKKIEQIKYDLDFMNKPSLREFIKKHKN